MASKKHTYEKLEMFQKFCIIKKYLLTFFSFVPVIVFLGVLYFDLQL